MRKKQSPISLIGKYNAIIILVAVLVIGAFVNPNFIRITNLVEVLQHNSELGLLSLGMTLVIISGNGAIDLTVGSMVGLSSVICGTLFINWRLGVTLSVLITVFATFLLGLLNGVVVVKGRVGAVIATFSMMIIIRGLAFLVTGGSLILFPIEKYVQRFTVLASGKVGPVHLITLYFITAVVILQIVGRYTPFGRYVYAVGGNIESARLQGINVDLIRILVFGISGALAGLAGVIMTARMSVGEPSAAEGYELVAIACVLIGGTSLEGGRGGFVRTLIGVFTIGLISNLLNLSGVSVFLTDAIKGFIVIFAALTPTLVSLATDRMTRSVQLT